MKISVFTTIPPGIYSGGRYLSLMLAYSVSRAGAEVTYVTDNEPLFSRDFDRHSTLCPIRTVVTPRFELPEDLTSDWVIVIPTGGFNEQFYNSAINHARQSGARIALLSFETPNWFATLSPFPRSPMPTESWRQVIAAGGLVVSIANEGVPFARSYFGEGTPAFPRQFGYWHPAVNDLAAASVSPVETARRRRVVMFTRTEDMHKGAQDLLKLPPDLFEGYVLTLVFGRGANPDYVAAIRRHFAKARTFAIDIQSQITDEEKFRLLSEARLLLFPSYFEGYGYPPVEAAWMGVPTVAYDLPLLREVANEAIWFAPRGDTGAFAELVRKSLAERDPGSEISALMSVQTDTLTAGRSLIATLNHAASGVQPVGNNPVGNAPDYQLPGLNAPARAIAAHSADGIDLFGASARLTKGRVEVSGSIAGLREAARLDLTLPGGELPSVDIAPAKKKHAVFCVDGVLAEWPELSDELCVGLRMTLRSGQEISLGSIPLTPDVTAMLSSPADGGLLATGDLLVVANPKVLVESPLISVALSELVATAQGAGHRVSLLVPEGAGTDIAGATMAQLPRFCALSDLGLEALRDRVARSISVGQSVVATPDMVELAGLADTRGTTLTIDGDAALIIAGSRAGAPETIAVRPDARRWGRHALAARRNPVVVVLPDTPIVMLGSEVAVSLRRIDMACGPCQFVIPESLVASPEPLADGIGLVVVPVNRAQLSGLLQTQVSAGLRIASDTLLTPAAQAETALLLAYHTPVHAVGTEGIQAVIAHLTGQEADAADSVAVAVRGVLDSSASPRHLAPNAVGRIRPDDGFDEVALPGVRAGDVLSFSDTRTDPMRGLLWGWQAVTQNGARISDDLAYLAFSTPSDASLPGGLELMLHVSPQPDPSMTVEIMLNDHHLGALPQLAIGSTTHRLPTPATAWRNGQNILRLRLRWTDAPNPNMRVGLTALSPMMPTPEPVQWASVRQTARHPAPFYTQGLESYPVRQSVRIGAGQAPGFLRLIAGWSKPEPGLVWSDGRWASIGFTAAMRADAPILLSLEGAGANLPVDAQSVHEVQRLRVRSNRQKLFEVALPAADGAVLIPFGMALTDHGISHLSLEFPDCFSPRALLNSSDERQLGFRVSGARTTLLSQRVGTASFTVPKGVPTWVVRLRMAARAGALRLQGSGPVPEGVRFMLVGGTVAASAIAIAKARWEVLLPLDDETLHRGRLVVACLAEDADRIARPDQIEIWSPEPLTESDNFDKSEIDITVFSVVGPRDDIRDILADDFFEAFEGNLIDPTTPRLELPSSFAMNRTGNGVALLGTGWSGPEAEATWTDGHAASIHFPAPAGPAVLLFDACAFLRHDGANQTVVLKANGVNFATLAFESTRFKPVHVLLPDACSPILRLGIDLPEAVSPMKLGFDEPRMLGVMLRSLLLSPVPASDPRPATVESSDPDIRIVASVIHDDTGMILVLCGTGFVPAGVERTARRAVTQVLSRAFATADGWTASLFIAQDQIPADGIFTVRIVAAGTGSWPIDPVILTEVSLSLASQGV